MDGGIDFGAAAAISAVLEDTPLWAEQLPGPAHAGHAFRLLPGEVICLATAFGVLIDVGQSETKRRPCCEGEV